MHAHQSVFCLLLFVNIGVSAQQKFGTDRGEVSFVSNADLELIKASSNKLKGLIDPSTNKFAFSVAVQTFRGFNSDLQREHFNEKYMESEKYPQLSFIGKIIEHVDFQEDGVYEVRAKGDLDIHGERQIRIIKSLLHIKDGVLSIDADFQVPLSDHNISIPRIVNQKIATEIQVHVTATMVVQQ